MCLGVFRRDFSRYIMVSLKHELDKEVKGEAKRDINGQYMKNWQWRE